MMRTRIEATKSRSVGAVFIRILPVLDSKRKPSGLQLSYGLAVSCVESGTRPEAGLDRRYDTRHLETFRVCATAGVPCDLFNLLGWLHDQERGRTGRTRGRARKTHAPGRRRGT